MPETLIEIPSEDYARLLFGPQDQYLRSIRKHFGMNAVYRDGTLKLSGELADLERAAQVVADCLKVIDRKGFLSAEALDQALQRDPTQREFPRTQQNETDVESASNSDTTDVPASTPMKAIDLFEKARKIVPRSEGQKRYTDALEKNDLVFCSGPAGSGKTYLAVAMALNALRRMRVQKIVLVRPAVEAGEKLGFLPGDLLAKVNPFLRPLLDAMNDMITYEQVKRYMENDIVEIVPLAFMRGRTLNHTFMILDEAQNTTVTQMKMFLTRMGTESKIVVTGDTTQNDLPPNITCGMTDAIKRLNRVKGVATVKLSGEDIVRHRLVREIVAAYDR